MSVVLEMVVEGAEAAQKVIDFYQGIEAGAEHTNQATKGWVAELDHAIANIQKGTASTGDWLAVLTGVNQASEAIGMAWHHVKEAVEYTLSPVEKVKELFEDVVAVAARYESGILRMKAATGASIEETEKLAIAGEHFGLSAEQMAQAEAMLTRQMYMAESGSKQAKEMFSAFGIEVSAGAGRLRPVSEVIEQLAGKFSEYADGADKSAAAMKFFRGEGSAMIPFLNAGKEGIEQFGNRFKELNLELENHKLGAQLTKDIRDVEGDITQLKLKLGDELIPAFKEGYEEAKKFGEGLIKDIPWNDVKSDIGIMVQLTGELLTGVTTLMEPFVKLGGAMGWVFASAVSGATNLIGKWQEFQHELDEFQIAHSRLLGLSAEEVVALRKESIAWEERSKQTHDSAVAWAKMADNFLDGSHKIIDVGFKAGEIIEGIGRKLQDTSQKTEHATEEEHKMSIGLKDQAAAAEAAAKANDKAADSTSKLGDAAKKTDAEIQSLTHHTSEWKAAEDKTVTQITNGFAGLGGITSHDGGMAKSLYAFNTVGSQATSGRSSGGGSRGSMTDEQAIAAGYTEAYTNDGEPILTDSSGHIVDYGFLNGGRPTGSAVGPTGFGNVTGTVDLSGGRGDDFLKKFEHVGGGIAGIGGGPGSIGRMMYGMGSVFEGQRLNDWANGGYEQYLDQMNRQKQEVLNSANMVNARREAAQEEEARRGAASTEAAQARADIINAQSIQRSYGNRNVSDGDIEVMAARGVNSRVLDILKGGADNVTNGFTKLNAIAEKLASSLGQFNSSVSSFRANQAAIKFVNTQSYDGSIA